MTLFDSLSSHMPINHLPQFGFGGHGEVVQVDPQKGTSNSHSSVVVAPVPFRIHL